MDLRPFVGNRRTSDPGRYARCAELVAAEPALGLGSPTIGWTAAAAEAVREFANPHYPGRIEARSLIITPGGDQIVSTAASREFAARSNSISYVLVEAAKHELLMERNNFRSQFWAAFDYQCPPEAGRRIGVDMVGEEQTYSISSERRKSLRPAMSRR